MTFMTRTFLLLTSFMVFTALAPAHAQDAKKEETKGAEKAESVLKKEAPANPHQRTPLDDWRDAENALIDPLSDKDKESFLILRNKYSIIRVVGIVERDVDNAVKACGKANPDIKEKMETRFKQWKGAVNPIIDTAKKTFDKDLQSQKVVDAKDVKKVLKLQDEAYEFNEKQITKTPVTTLKACEGLLASMDRTEDSMIGLLEKTLLPESALRQEREQSLKAKAKVEAMRKSAPAAESPKTE